MKFKDVNIAGNGNVVGNCGGDAVKAVKAKKNNFYYEGVFYQTEEEFHDAVMKYNSSEVSPISAERIFADMCKGMMLNLFNPPEFNDFLTNADLKFIVDECIINFVSRLRQVSNENRDKDGMDKR